MVVHLHLKEKDIWVEGQKDIVYFIFGPSNPHEPGWDYQPLRQALQHESLASHHPYRLRVAWAHGNHVLWWGLHIQFNQPTTKRLRGEKKIQKWKVPQGLAIIMAWDITHIASMKRYITYTEKTIHHSFMPLTQLTHWLDLKPSCSLFTSLLFLWPLFCTHLHGLCLAMDFLVAWTKTIPS